MNERSVWIAGLFLPLMAFSQSGVHVEHAVENACNGRLTFYDGNGSVDSVVWSTGDVGLVLSDLTPGTYGFEVFVDGQVVDQGSREVELVGWEISALTYYHSEDAFTLNGTASMEYCLPFIFTGLCCQPDPEVTTLVILQDGEPFALTSENCQDCEQLDCIASIYYAVLPFGHIYDVGVNDPTCGGVSMMGMDLIAHSCANLEVTTEVTAAAFGEANGSITLVEVIPDPNEPYPISSPVLGTASLYNATTMEMVEQFTNVGTAMWNDLEAGAYEVHFNSDQYCQPYTTVIEVPAGTTGLAGVASRSELRVFPAITDGTLYVSAANEDPIDLRIMDVHGRELMRSSQSPGSFDAGALPAGPYVAWMQQGSARSSARFIKR